MENKHSFHRKCLGRIGLYTLRFRCVGLGGPLALWGMLWNCFTVCFGVVSEKERAELPTSGGQAGAHWSSTV